MYFVFCICMTDLLQGSHAWGLFARQLLRIYPASATSQLQDLQGLGWKERAGKVQYSKPFLSMIQQSARKLFKEIVWFHNPHFQVVRAIVVRWAFILSSCLQVGFDFKLGSSWQSLIRMFHFYESLTVALNTLWTCLFSWWTWHSVDGWCLKTSLQTLKLHLFKTTAHTTTHNNHRGEV